MSVLASSLFDLSVSALFTSAECTYNVNWLNCKILKVYVSKCNLLMICIM